MSVEADGPAAVKVIQKHVLLGQRVMIRRHLTPVKAEFGIAVALGKIAEHLIVGAVLLNDEKYVANSKRRKVRHTARRFHSRTVRCLHLAPAGRHLGWTRSRNRAQGAFVVQGIERALAI